MLRTPTLLCPAGRVVSVTNELRKIIPVFLPLLDPPVKSRENVSAAHLIVATSHAPGRSETHVHDCPVLAGTLPLTALANHSAFLKRPCFLCLRRRVHFLASEHFCMNFEEQCSQGGGGVPAELEGIIKKQFGSVAHLEEELIMYATSRREPGWTWLVYDKSRLEGHRLVVVNFPANRVPLVMGLWPLAVINMNEGQLLAAMEATPTTNAARSSPPSWSRAARNPSVMSVSTATVMTGPATQMTGGAGEDLTTIRHQVAREAVAKMNWGFVMRQLHQAEVYYNSAERDEKIRAQRSKLEREAALAAMSKLRDSGATILTSDTVEVTMAGSGVSGENKFQSQMKSAPTQAPQEAAKNSTKTAADGATSDQDPHCTQLSDGTWQYAYRNGDLTLLRPDGTKVFRKSDLTTTVFLDGSTLYEYPNNTSILDRADGIRVTTFADGTKKEERIR